MFGCTCLWYRLITDCLVQVGAWLMLLFKVQVGAWSMHLFGTGWGMVYALVYGTGWCMVYALIWYNLVHGL
jgi:hypothetical protein